jgi:hypothetical protein
VTVAKHLTVSSIETFKSIILLSGILILNSQAFHKIPSHSNSLTGVKMDFFFSLIRKPAFVKLSNKLRMIYAIFEILANTKPIIQIHNNFD